MAEPKTRPTDASVAEFMDALEPEQRRADCQALAGIMERASGEPPVMWGTSIVGFGSRPIAYANGSTADWPLIGFSPRKSDLTLYVMGGLGDHEPLLARLGRHRMGKGCLYLKRLSDVDPAVLEELVRLAVAHGRAAREGA